MSEITQEMLRDEIAKVMLSTECDGCHHIGSCGLLKFADSFYPPCKKSEAIMSLLARSNVAIVKEKFIVPTEITDSIKTLPTKYALNLAQMICKFQDAGFVQVERIKEE